MRDKIFAAFLQRQCEEGLALAEASDLLELYPMPTVENEPPQTHIARFLCNGLVKSSAGEIVEASHFEVMINFPSDYLRRADPFQVLTWFGPRNVFHPNISNRAPVICVGKLAPSTPLVDLLYQTFEIITYNKVTMREDDALNQAACKWARENQHRFPIDRRPLKRRALNVQIEEIRKVGAA